MQKRTSSQIYSKSSGQNNNQSPNDLIDNIAKSLMEIQNNTKPMNATDSETAEIKALLKRISAQLDCMQQSNQAKSQKSSNNGMNVQDINNQTAEEQANQQQDSQVTQDLQKLFNQLLVNDRSYNSRHATQSLEKNNPSTEVFKQQNKITAQTAAQALAQAQYELSTELEASLRKLKQVISESEKLANKISNLLSEENNKQG